MVAAMEDSGTLQALTFLNQAGRVDLRRVLVLRTVSNYDREAPGVPVAESLQEMVSGNYSAYMPALEAAQTVGDKVVWSIGPNVSPLFLTHRNQSGAEHVIRTAGIDEPWKNGCFAEIVNLVTPGRYSVGRNNSLDSFSFHQDGRQADAFGSDHSASEESLQTQGVSSLEDRL